MWIALLGIALVDLGARAVLGDAVISGNFTLSGFKPATDVGSFFNR